MLACPLARKVYRRYAYVLALDWNRKVLRFRFDVISAVQITLLIISMHRTSCTLLDSQMGFMDSLSKVGCAPLKYRTEKRTNHVYA